MQTSSLNGEKLQSFLDKLGWTKEHFALMLKANGYEIEVHKIQKWIDGLLQPNAKRIELIEAVVKGKVTNDPPARRPVSDGRRSPNLSYS